MNRVDLGISGAELQNVIAEADENADGSIEVRVQATGMPRWNRLLTHNLRRRHHVDEPSTSDLPRLWDASRLRLDYSVPKNDGPVWP